MLKIVTFTCIVQYVFVIPNRPVPVKLIVAHEQGNLIKLICRQKIISYSRRAHHGETEEIVSLAIQIDMSVGNAYCEIDEDCVICIPQYTGKKCGCPDGFTIQNDNSCLNDGTGRHIQTPKQLVLNRRAMSFHERFQARLRGK